MYANQFFFVVLAASINDPSLPTALLTGFTTMQENPVLFSVFGYDKCWS